MTDDEAASAFNSNMLERRLEYQSEIRLYVEIRAKCVPNDDDAHSI